MKSSSLFPLIFVAATTTVLPLLAATNVQPPQLAAFDLAPTLVNASDSNQTIIVTIRVTADSPGIGPPGGAVSVSFLSPSRSQFASVSFVWLDRVSGDERDGVYVRTMTLPKFSEPGDWKLAWASLQDASGYTRLLERADFIANSLPAQFTAQGTG